MPRCAPAIRPHRINSSEGFTLIEILVVMMLISLVTAFTIPAIRTELFTDQLKSTARRLIGLVNEVGHDAVYRQSEYFLHFDLENNIVWADAGIKTDPDRDDSEERVTGKRLELPDSIAVTGITSAHGGSQSQGTAILSFSKKGYVDRTAIHLSSDDGRDLTIVLSPFLGVSKIFDSYRDLEDIDYGL